MQQFSWPDERRLSTTFHFFWRYLLSTFRCMRCLRGGRGYSYVLLFSSPKCPDQLRGPLLFMVYRGLVPQCESGRGMKPSTRPHLVPKLWMGGAILHHMPLWNVLSVSWNKHVLVLHRIVWRESSNYGDFLVSAGTQGSFCHMPHALRSHFYRL
jgi:hypothetical protein